MHRHVLASPHHGELCWPELVRSAPYVPSVNGSGRSLFSCGSCDAGFHLISHVDYHTHQSTWRECLKLQHHPCVDNAKDYFSFYQPKEVTSLTSPPDSTVD